MCTKLVEFWILEITGVVLYRNNMYKFTTHNVSIEPHKTRRQFHPPFSIYALENSWSGQTGGLRDCHNYISVRSEFPCTIYLRVFKLISTFTEQSGIYCVPGES